VKLLQANFKKDIVLKDIEINTVDQFQGRDKRIIIMSFTNSIVTNEPTKV
jgi:superfamily I DNA and/or RNA helicase